MAWLKMLGDIWQWGFGPLYFDKPDPPDPHDTANLQDETGRRTY